jgi:hypothetical protein
MRHVSKTATCKKCNSDTVAWAKSKRSGKFYLTEVFIDYEDDQVTDYRDFHSAYCGKPELHAAKQAELRGDFQVEVEDDDAPDDESAKFFLALHDLCKSDPEAARAGLASRQSRLARIQAPQEAARLTAEISFMLVALGDVAPDVD